MSTEKSFATVFAETKEEIKDFVRTRVQLLRAEIAEKSSTWKYSVPLLALAVGLLLIGWIVLTFALVALVRAWFVPSIYAWLWAGLIIAAIYLIAGGTIGWFAYTELLETGLAPRRTLEVLKQDQVWVENERRAA